MTGWLQAAGEVLLYEEEPGSGRWQLLGRDSLEVITEIGPFDSLLPTQDDSALVGQTRGDRDTGDRVLLFETDGTLRWEHEVSSPAGSLVCCTRAQLDGDELVLPPVVGTTSPLRLDLADGSRVSPASAQPGETPAPAAGSGTRWLSPHTALTFADNGDGETLVWHDGHHIAIRGSFSGLRNLEPPFIFIDETGPVAVQPVTTD